MDHARAKRKLGSQVETFAILSVVGTDGLDRVITAMKVVREKIGPGSLDKSQG